MGNLIVFDFDKTIARFPVSSESFSKTKQALEKYLQKKGLPSTSLKPILPMIGSLSVLSGEKKQIRAACYALLDSMELESLRTFEVPSQNIALIKKISAKHPVAILSNNGRKPLLKALNIMGLEEDSFAFILSRDDLEYPKPFSSAYDVLKGYDECLFLSDDIIDFVPLHETAVSCLLVLNCDLTCCYEWPSMKEYALESLL